MRKIILIVALVMGCAITGYAQQNTFPTSGNVGIGVTSPQFNLDIRGQQPQLQLFETATGTNKRFILSVADNEVRFMSSFGTGGNYPITFRFGGSAGEAMRIRTDGNVGIGTTNPGAKLHVNGNTRVEGTALVVGNSGVHGNFSVSSSDGNPAGGITTSGDPETANGVVIFNSRGSGHVAIRTNHTGNVAERMRITSNGNVGIGITNPNTRLAVNGVIRAKEVKVESANWPDYVFEEDYKLQPLAEVEAFVKANKHLPGIPDKTAIAKNGVELGEMNRLLLEKVEELTLRLIEQEKDIDELRKLLKAIKIKKKTD